MGLILGALNHGAGGAQSGTPQYPTLFSDLGYAVRPPWPVAGVDYFVGADPAKVTKAVGTDALPGGFSLDNVNKRVTVSDALSTYTISGYDFSTNGGYIFNCATGRSAILDNCKLTVTSALSAKPRLVELSVGSTAPVTLQNCTLDGASNAFGNVSGCIPNANFIGKYNHFKNFDNDCIVPAGKFTSILIAYNLLEAGCWESGAHADFCQISNLASPSGLQSGFRMLFNTGYQPSANSDGFPGMMNSFCRIGNMNGFSINNPELGWNVMAGAGTSHFADVDSLKTHKAYGKMIEWLTTNDALAESQINDGNIHDNYIDATMADFFVNYPISSAGNVKRLTWARNIDIKTGNTISLNV